MTRAELNSAIAERALTGKGKVTKKAVDKSLSKMRASALIWGVDPISVVPAVIGMIPWRVGRALEPAEAMTETEISAALNALDTRERDLLETLANSSPIGRTRDAAPGTPPERPVQRLLAAGLLRWLDEQTVELPATVRQVIRGEPVFDPTTLTAPVIGGGQTQAGGRERRSSRRGARVGTPMRERDRRSGRSAGSRTASRWARCSRTTTRGQDGRSRRSAREPTCRVALGSRTHRQWNTRPGAGLGQRGRILDAHACGRRLAERIHSASVGGAGVRLGRRTASSVDDRAEGFHRQAHRGVVRGRPGPGGSARSPGHSGAALRTRQWPDCIGRRGKSTTGVATPAMERAPTDVSRSSGLWTRPPRSGWWPAARCRHLDELCCTAGTPKPKCSPPYPSPSTTSWSRQI